MRTEQTRLTPVGIDDMAAYIPKIYLPIATLAEERNLEYAKLNKGLGLEAMAVADAHEDVATMAANAVLELMEKNRLRPQEVGRIYMGTESSVDGSKPMATYVLEMLTQYYEALYGPDCFLNCDVVDLTFACIGAVDALQNTLDWVKGGENRIGIVVGSDNAKYELGSGGEYTQGAGSIALLVKQNPRLISIGDAWGVATRPVHDFFKPLRIATKESLLHEALKLAGKGSQAAREALSRLAEMPPNGGVLTSSEANIMLHKETPVFDGPYSNACYQERIREALTHFAPQAGYDVQAEAISGNWDKMAFHLPYAFQARRMFPEVYLMEAKATGKWASWAKEYGLEEPARENFGDEAAFEKAHGQFLRAISKTDAYQVFVQEKIAAGERASSLVGNLYTSSIFLSLMSILETALEGGEELQGRRFGFFAYGSGSKSKVFEGELQAGWKEATRQFRLMERLARRTAIDYYTYEQLHRGQAAESALPVQNEFFLKEICHEKGVLEGARTYARATEAAVLEPGA
ncbi:MAG: hypothetical protein KDD06_04470 [Phaeodactylibacter sp.]|nr:hypothetical protein [Phaeodactylibacter sp.]MCB9263922.1 hypothetical protein [Lewinellaceae bacterium]MCB9288152.1 hypothetical protein [Lewinellaceae bacterium]